MKGIKSNYIRQFVCSRWPRVSVKISIPSSCHEFTGGQSVAEVGGDTVGECLDDLARQFPGIPRGLFDREGKLLDYLAIYVNLKSTYSEGLDTPVKDGDKLDIVLFPIAGG